MNSLAEVYEQLTEREKVTLKMNVLIYNDDYLKITVVDYKDEIIIEIEAASQRYIIRRVTGYKNLIDFFNGLSDGSIRIIFISQNIIRIVGGGFITGLTETDNVRISAFREKSDSVKNFWMMSACVSMMLSICLFIGSICKVLRGFGFDIAALMTIFGIGFLVLAVYYFKHSDLQGEDSYDPLFFTIGMLIGFSSEGLIVKEWLGEMAAHNASLGDNIKAVICIALVLFFILIVPYESKKNSFFKMFFNILGYETKKKTILNDSIDVTGYKIELEDEEKIIDEDYNQLRNDLVGNIHNGNYYY
ncbi:MAG: hypothetical protein IJ167_07365 [Lachnospiraceae bacterium]|nr:hypothetical protein [Lachnospiraceae bacterium]